MNLVKYTIAQFHKDFPHDDACLDYMFVRRFPHPVCPQCHRKDTFSRVAKRKCYACICGYQIHPTAGTIFHKSSTIAGQIYTFTDNFTSTSQLSLGNGGGGGGGGGTATFNGNVTIPSFVSSSSISSTRVLNMGTGTWTLNSTGTVWTITDTGVSVNSSTSTIVISDTSATSKTFVGGGFTYYNLSITGGGTGAVNMGTAINTETYNQITINAPKTVTIFSGKTLSLANPLVATGSVGNVITINASTGGSAAILSLSSGIVSCDYLSLQDSTAQGGAFWYAGANSTNVSGNTGWKFYAPPAATLTETLTLVAVFSRTETRTFSEVLTLVETFIRSDSKTFLETVTLVETFIRTTNRTFSETVTLVESTIIKTSSRVFTETLTLTETFIRSMQRTFTESLTLVEKFRKLAKPWYTKLRTMWEI